MDISDKFVVSAGHITEAYGPVQAAKNYLIKNAGEFISIEHPFSYSGLEGTVVEFYKGGSLVKKEKGHKRSSNSLMQWARDYFFNISFMKKLKKKADVFLAVDNLNAASGIKLKKQGLAGSLVYYIIDHMDRRFSNPVFNFLYETADRGACEKSDYIWSLSPRIAEAKEKRFEFERKKNLIVPVGIELDKISPFKKEEKLKSREMVFMGVLDKTKGVQVMIEAMKDITEKVKEAKLIIIGTGPYEPELKKQAEKLNLLENIEFMGAMGHDEIFKIIPRFRVGLAPYSDDPNSYTYYADPTKPKEYLGCGLPLVITNVPWIAEEADKRPMGVVCNYNKEEIAKAAVKLLEDDGFYETCLNNAVEFASGLSWDNIYKEAFEKMK